MKKPPPRLLGHTTTTYRAIRACLGHPASYDIKHIKIGNEDNFGGCHTYASRFTSYYDAIHAAYPNLIIIASGNCPLNPLPTGAWNDIHHYERPSRFVELLISLITMS
jgi:alpha-L-arabinofuranosidase